MPLWHIRVWQTHVKPKSFPLVSLHSQSEVTVFTLFPFFKSLQYKSFHNVAYIFLHMICKQRYIFLHIKMVVEYIFLHIFL